MLERENNAGPDLILQTYSKSVPHVLTVTVLLCVLLKNVTMALLGKWDGKLSAA
jgi:hypothetical protein